MSEGHTNVTVAVEPCGSPDHPDCGLRELLPRLGDRWSVMTIAELSQGPRRFREVQRGLHGISQRMLTRTLRLLERDGLVLRTVYPTVPPSVTYELTERGESLRALVGQLTSWSLAHKDAIAESRARWDAGRAPGARPA